ncbi:MAG: polymerase, sigma-24 subunit, RpoE, subfamily [Pelosinus sp.]|jgi:RNA polymerase sigma-70 factor (ECF subfamily)|nr:polymerase, sigma-24 subunit, RpoE, subfamily [Pelosinus sp.]
MNQMENWFVYNIGVFKGGDVLVSDEELALQMQIGSEEALEEIVKRYHGPIHVYILRMSSDYHATHDIVQDVFIKMCRGIRYYKPELPFRAWLYSIASNAYKDYQKKAYVRKVIPGLEEIKYCLSTTVTPEETCLKNYERTRIIEAVNSLSDIYRETLILRYYEELKLDEIANALKIPTGTVKSRLSKALSQLKQIFSAKEF